MKSVHIDALVQLFERVFRGKPQVVVPIKGSGSSRRYYRLKSAEVSCIGAFNSDVKENETFFYLSEHLARKGLTVPNILSVSICRQYYLQTDLGQTSLFDLIGAPNTSTPILPLLEQTVRQLARFNMVGFDGLDVDKLYPVKHFDRKSVMWDLYYFKYSLLKPSGITFDESELEGAFDFLADVVLGCDLRFLQYRDFQSRNVMVFQDKPYFIDYQGARIGSGLYDLASFLYQARANFDEAIRNDLLNLYIAELGSYRNVDSSYLREVFPYMVVLRILQTLGAYGFRGLVERKVHFIQSLPLALTNLSLLLRKLNSNRLVYLEQLVNRLIETYSISLNQSETLRVNIYSFSLKSGYPPIHPEHGGGFVFDCRFLPNPGRFDEFKSLTGLDDSVKGFLNGCEAVRQFMENVKSIVDVAVFDYINRNFKHLSVAFGCTGGQHRSVFCAEQLAEHLRKIPSIAVTINHLEIDKS